MLSKCLDCGIVDDLTDGRKWCLKYLFDVSSATVDNKADCYYFIKPQCEDGEPMTAKQNLMIKECELASRRMRGPV